MRDGIVIPIVCSADKTVPYEGFYSTRYLRLCPLRTHHTAVLRLMLSCIVLNGIIYSFMIVYAYAHFASTFT